MSATYEVDPIDVYRDLSFDAVRNLLDVAVAGLSLGAYDRRIIEWLKTTDQPTIATVANIITTARSAQ